MSKKLLCTLLLLTLGLSFAACSNNKPTQESAAADQINYSQLSVTAITKLTSGDLTNFYQMFDQNMKKALPENDLKDIWNNLTKQYGTFQYYNSDFKLTNQDGHTIATIPCTFENQTLDVLLSFNSSGEISGLYFTENKNSNNRLRLENDIDISFSSGEYNIAGSLNLPEGEGPFPLVILVHGSGASDRNEQIGPNQPFMDIAAQLAQAGIASLRYDKRTYTYAKEFAGLTDITVQDETIDDVLAALDFASTLPEIDNKRIYILGHSLGGYLMPRIAEQTPEAAGYIMLAPSARPLEDLILEQTQYILSIDKTTAQETKDKLLQQTEKTVELIKSLTPDSDLSAEQLMGVPASYWLDLQKYDPLTTLTKIEKPILIMQGGRDYQVTSTDYQLWQEALAKNDNVTFCYYDNLNHLFMSGTGKSTPNEYQTKGTVHEQAVQDVINFILGLSPTPLKE